MPASLWAATGGKPGKLSLYLQLIRWNRPAGWLLLLWPTLSALWVASHGFPGWHLISVFTLGTFLMRSAGCCVNDVADQDFDRHVKRTARELFPVADKASDEPTADLLTQRLTVHEQTAWMLRSLLED